MKLYKILAPDGSPVHGGTGKWHLPKGKRPGRWMPSRKPVLCFSGYHLIPASAVWKWWKGDCVLWEAEGRGKREASDEKTAYGSARLVRRVGILTAPARKAYNDAIAPAWKAYDDAIAPAGKAYNDACEHAIVTIFKGKEKA